MLIAFGPVVVLCIEVAIYLGTLRPGLAVIVEQVARLFRLPRTKERQPLFAADFRR